MKDFFKYLEPYYDNYNICNRIKEIDNYYKLYFNKKEKLFIILNSAKNNQICLKTASISPDIIKTLQKTLVENSILLFKEIDKYNDDLLNAANNDLKDKAICSAVEISKYSKRVNKISQKDINKIKEGKYA